MKHLLIQQLFYLFNEREIVWFNFLHINPNFALAVKVILAAHRKAREDWFLQQGNIICKQDGQDSSSQLAHFPIRVVDFLLEYFEPFQILSIFLTHQVLICPSLMQGCNINYFF